MAKGALRIAWLLGGWLTPLGLLSFLPAAPFNLIYKLVAKYRYYLFKKSCVIIRDKVNFLE